MGDAGGERLICTCDTCGATRRTDRHYASVGVMIDGTRTRIHACSVKCLDNRRVLADRKETGHVCWPSAWGNLPESITDPREVVA